MSLPPICSLLVTLAALAPRTVFAQEGQGRAAVFPPPHFAAAWDPAMDLESQRVAALGARISLELHDIPLELALKALIGEAKLRLTFSSAVLPVGRRITISAEDSPVRTILSEILSRSGLDVMVDRDGTLAIVPCSHGGAGPRSALQGHDIIVGIVTDRATGHPLSGATVSLDGTGSHATTGPDGRYRMGEVNRGTYTISARYIGYASLSVTVDVTTAVTSADMALDRSRQMLNEVVTTGTFVPTKVMALPTPITVITADEIAEQRPQALLDVIRQAVPTAVGFERPSGSSSQTFFSVRGVSSLSGSSPLKILLDGIEVTSFTLAPVDPRSIERVEVIRGPQVAAVYGADAAGGVIHIFTKHGEAATIGPRLGLEAGLGILQTPYTGHRGVLRQEYNGEVSGSARAMTYHVGGGYTHLDDFVPNGDPSRQSIPSVYGGMQFKRGILKADLSGRHYRNRLPATLNPAVLTSGFTPFSRPLYEMNDRTNETFGAQVSVMPLNWWLHRVTAGVDRHVHKATQTQRRFTTPGDTLLALSDGRSRKLSFSYHTIATITRTGVVGGSMTMGIDYYDRESNVFSTTRALNTDGTIITSPPGSFQRTRTRIRNTGYFAQGQVSLRESLFMTAAIRAEESTTFGVDLTTPLLPRVGLSFVPVRGRTTVKLRGSWGRGIRSPSPGQAFGLANAFQIHLANTTLAPEEQAGWDAGIDITLGSTASLSLTGFDQTASNLIILIPLASTPIPVYQFQNTGQVSNRGVEVEASLVRRELTLKAHYSYVRSRIAALGPTFDGDLQIGDQPEGIPAHTAAATMTYASRTGTTVTAAATHIGNLRGSDAVGLFRCLGGTGPCPSGSRFSITYPALTKFNVGVRRRLSQSLEGYLAIDNLTNNQSYEADNINPVLGRLTMAGLQAAF